eukprot:CAMPEP_0177460760 /NCGR_PEP_ID=MMETSP0369-20130122/14845_1 /TAXON_ID=447022 ORGANISM="Scrippsiella hangoei-like, Strain SHHI-4" /NCGR_SAMPLE_ID=MMETSP0369 /ASSEMBLY_ACC=CAM_ASM_000364 /LENGTH=208 /DNA_ID=CAMNT_0018934185 /DNA_START=80 /DNA_END=706 /DNA_ORIENTATION=+
MGKGGEGKGGWGMIWAPLFAKGMFGKGKGKGKMSANNFAPEKKVWIGGIAEGTEYKELHEHFKVAGAKWVEVWQGNGNGTGVACFSTAEEAAAAISTLNGSELKGGTLVVDVWEKKPKALRLSEEWPCAQPIGERLGSETQDMGLMLVAAPVVDELVHMIARAPQPKHAHFRTATETGDRAAISTLNGSEISGGTLVVDVWEKKEKAA